MPGIFSGMEYPTKKRMLNAGQLISDLVEKSARVRGEEMRTRESSQVPTVLTKKIKAWKAEDKRTSSLSARFGYGKSFSSWRIRTSRENLKCNESGTDDLSAHVTQTFSTAGVKGEQLTLLKEELCQTSRTLGRTE